MQAHEREFCNGTVERVTFHSEESGFCVIKIKARGKRDLVTVTGNVASIRPSAKDRARKCRNSGCF
jgi:D-alanyl-D-alanine carboxypeptidase